MRTITLRYPAVCHDCGAELPAGTRARWYGRGRVYGIGCHADTRPPEERAAARRARAAVTARARGPLGYVYSCLDPHGVYTPDGRKLGSTCGCEDYPCCGH